MSADAEGKPMMRVGGVDFDLSLAPDDLQRKWQVTHAAFEVAKGADRVALKNQLAAVGREIVIALAPTMLMKLAMRNK